LFFYTSTALKMLANAQALSVLFALLSCKTPAHLFAKPPTEMHNARQCSGIVCAFRHVELQNTCASIRQTTCRNA